MKKILSIFFAALLSSCSIKQEPMPIYVEPFYSSNPFKIAVGEYSAKLRTNSRSELHSLAVEIKERVDEVNIETLFVLAIRMYDLGMKDEASYWYYTAQFRKNIFIYMENRTTGSDMSEYLQAFKQLSGKWINGYAYGDPDKLVAILEQVIKDTEDMGYVGKVYPNMYEFKHQEEQAAYVQKQADEILEHITYIRENKEEILRTRKENGVEGKY
jgi:hypothetical protein